MKRNVELFIKTNVYTHFPRNVISGAEYYRIPEELVEQVIDEMKLNAVKIAGYSHSGRHSAWKSTIFGKPVFIVLRNKHGIVNYYGDVYSVYKTRKEAMEKYNSMKF